MGKKQQSSGSDSRKQFIHSVFPRPDSSYPEGWILFFFWLSLLTSCKIDGKTLGSFE